MAARNGDDAGKHIEVALARFVEQPLHVAFDDEQRFAVQCEDRRTRVLLSHHENFGARRPRVRLGLVLGRRHLEPRGLRASTPARRGAIDSW